MRIAQHEKKALLEKNNIAVYRCHDLCDTIVETLVSGEKVQMVGFGVFDVKERGVRIGRNPKTREEIEIPASKVPFFKAGKALKDAVAE